MPSKKNKIPEPEPSLIGEIFLPCSFLTMLVGVMASFIYRHFSLQPAIPIIPESHKANLLFNDMDFIWKKYQCNEYIKPYSRDFYTKCGGYFSFSNDYYHSRERFRNLSKLNKLPTTYKYIDKKQDLTMDFSIIDGNDPSKLLIYICGIHGVESLIGSSIMLNLLMQLRNDTLPNLSPNILLVHGYNPYGFAKRRRVNQNNVDLNRNILLTQKEWDNVLNRDDNIAGYQHLKTLFNTPPNSGSWIETIKFYLSIAYYYIIKGQINFTKSLITGQYHDKQGLYYGGIEMQKEHKMFYKVLMENKLLIYNMDTLKQVIIVDIHSGFGRSGLDTLIIDTIKEYELIKHVIPSDIYNASDGRLDISYNQQTDLNNGGTSNWCKIFTKKYNNNNIDKQFNEEMLQFYQANIGKIDKKSMKLIQDYNVDIKCTAIIQQFGTTSSMQILKALIDENVFTNRGRSTLQKQKKVRKSLFDAFYVDSDEWRNSIIWNGNNFFDIITKV